MITTPTATELRTFSSTVAPAHFKLRCHYCSHWVLPQDIAWGRHEGGGKVCSACARKWLAAVNDLYSGRFPSNCQACSVAFDSLEANENGDIRLSLHWKDGVVQVLCSRCSDAYERKRLDQFGDTAYGQAKKLKGAK